MDDTMEKDAQLTTWAKGISAITLFVEDLEAAKEFYQIAFELPVFFEDDASTVFKFGNTLVNLLDNHGRSRTHPTSNRSQSKCGTSFYVYNLSRQECNILAVSNRTSCEGNGRCWQGGSF